MNRDEIYLKHILDACEKVTTYVSVDLDAVWEITQSNLPSLKLKIEMILSELDKGE